MKNKKDKFYKFSHVKGISLITLVITIIVIIILAGAVILSLANNNPIESANKAVFMSDVSEYNSELSLYIIDQYAKNQGNFDPKDVNYTGQGAKDEGIISFKEEHVDKFEIQEGKLVYVGTDPEEIEWSQEAGIEATEAVNLDSTAPQVSINVTAENGNITGTITLTDNESGVNIVESKYIIDTRIEIYTTDDAAWNTATALSTNPQNISETKSAGEYYIQVLSVDNKGNKKVTLSNKIEILEIIDTGYNSAQGVNGPVLKVGMTPVKWSGSELVTTTTSDTSWYNYSSGSKQWANAQTADGSLWVWIPRYEYKITTPHTSAAKTVQINFIQGTGAGEGGNWTTTYGLHQAFTFGGTQLTGIWVAKFEASGNVNAVDVKPGITSLRNTTVGAIFDACRNMETNNRYGWGTSGVGIDTHLIKNMEWGAVAYLSNSVYGKNAEVTINSDTNYYTGGGSTNSYISNAAQSTTGNVYGVYDMSGDSWEYVAAYVSNGNSNLATYGGNLTAVGTDAKYRDVYTVTTDTSASNYNNSNNSSKKGDAIYETSASGEGTSSWYGDYSATMPYSSYTFFFRGGDYSNSTGAGVFAFGSCYGNDSNNRRV